MKSFLKDYNRYSNMTNEYNPVAMVNEDLDKHPDWKIIQILSSDNYHFYVVYEIKVPRKPRTKKGEVAPVVEEKPWVEPTLETIEKTPEDEIVVEEPTEPANEIPRMVDLVRQVKQGE